MPAARRALIEAMMKVHQYSMMCASIISQEAALEALEHGEDGVKRMREQYHRRRDFVVRRFNEIGLACHRPRGSFYAFPSVAVTGLNDRDFALGLLQAEKVAVVPGTAFGDERRRLRARLFCHQLRAAARGLYRASPGSCTVSAAERRLVVSSG